MRGLLFYMVICLLVYVAQAQILVPLGKGLPSAPDKIASHQNGLAAAFGDRDNHINVHVWNGDFWYSLPAPILPKTSSEYKIIDLISFGNELYLASGYVSSSTTTSNSIVKWDGQSWASIGNNIITESLSISRLFPENGKLKCIGKFKKGAEESNVASLNDATWALEGNLITNNIQRDNFESIVYHDNSVYATGTFTNPQNANLSLVKWNGQEWTLTNFPPFLSKNIALGTYQGNVVAYGTSNFTTAPIKISQGENWANLAVGLENYTVENIKQFAELDGQLLALGSFVQSETKERSYLMLYDGFKWNPSTISLTTIDQIYSEGQNVLLSGDFDDNGILRGVGQIIANKAQVVSRVFNDKNSNCIKDGGEEWLPHYPVQLSEVDILPTENNGVLYAQIEKDKMYTINAANYQHYVPTCPSVVIEAKEYKSYFTTAFGAKQIGGVSDAKIYLTDNIGNKYLSGQPREATLCITNIGSQPITDAKVSLKLPQGVGDLSADQKPENIVNDEVTWTVSLSAKTNVCIGLTYTLDGFDDKELLANVVLTGGVFDEDNTNNISSFVYSSGENRPNNKQCLNGKQIDPSEKELRYKINISNDNAATVNAIKVVDVLDEDIVRSAAGIFITTSHPGAITYSDYEFIVNENGKRVLKIVTTIEGVSINSAAENESNSTAFIDYQIGIRSDLMAQDAEICNTAKIYLSFANGVYGEAITTNTVCAYMSETLGVSGASLLPVELAGLEIGPNPVGNSLAIKNSSHRTVVVRIANNVGQEMGELKVERNSNVSMDVSGYRAGVYFVYANGLFAKKIVIH